MNELSPALAELRLLPEAVKSCEAIVAVLDSGSILEAIQIRASTLTPVSEEVLRFRPSSHWGINE
jgi:hypothetical protein